MAYIGGFLYIRKDVHKKGTSNFFIFILVFVPKNFLDEPKRCNSSSHVTLQEVYNFNALKLSICLFYPKHQTGLVRCGKGFVLLQQHCAGPLRPTL